MADVDLITISRSLHASDQPMQLMSILIMASQNHSYYWAVDRQEESLELDCRYVFVCNCSIEDALQLHDGQKSRQEV